MKINKFNGSLFKYAEKLTAFTNDVEKELRIIFIAGLGDDLMTCDCSIPLYTFCNENSIEFVQLRLDSSSNGYGTSSLKRDAQNINAFINACQPKKIIFFGHSTGCQSILTFVNSEFYEKVENNILGCILQGNVSDREYEEYINPNLKQLSNLNIGKNQLMPIDSHPCPILKERFDSLFGINGQDDMFSSDLDQVLQESTFFSKSKFFIVLCEKDEYLPSHVNNQQLQKRYCQFRNVLDCRILNSADHSISDPSLWPAFKAMIADALGLFSEDSKSKEKINYRG